MSQLKVNTIRHTGASSDAITLASDGTATAKVTNLPVSNLVIGGSMQVAQRGTSSTSSGYQTVDRFAVDFSGTDEACTQAQVDVTAGTTPYTKGFRKALKITNGNQTGGAGTTDYVRVRHVFEAQNLANSGWDFKSNSSYLTFSFWVKSSVAQNFYGFFRNSAGTMYQYPFETGSLSADTWTKVTKTIPGNSNLTLNDDNAAGLELYFHAFAGTGETASGVSLNTWTTYSGTAKMPDNTSTWYTTNDATLEVTGFQLTVTDYCPDYPHIPYGDELARCQRYCYEHFLGANQYASVMLATYYNSSTLYATMKFPVTMRTAPTMVCTDIADAFNVYRDGGVDFVNEFHIGGTNEVGPNAAELVSNSEASGTGGQAAFVRRGSNSTTTFRFEAEL